MTNTFNAGALGLAIFAVAALAIAAPAAAQTAEAPISVSVPYADLDIGHAAGAKVLFERIKTAAVRACGGEPDLRQLDQRSRFDQCRAETIGRTVTQLDAPMLTAVASHGVEPVSLASR